MQLFEYNKSETINSFVELKSIIDKQGKNQSFIDSAKEQRLENANSLENLSLDNQFVIFQLGTKKDQPAILESSQVIPTLTGSDNEPDILVALEMLSFSIGAFENVDKNTRATMRINIGKDENSRDKYFDTAFWSIAAGLNLYNESINSRTAPKELKSNFKQAFGNRPIEIPGGLSKMTFEVVKHEEPKWWQRIFTFLNSNAGKSLVSTIGFPAITTPAINMLDELLNRLDQNEPEILFKSLPLRLALSEQAKKDFTGGNERISMGCLNPGICILARGRDYETILDSNPNYYPSLDRLVPANVSERDLLSNRFEDPFKNMTYSIFRVGMKQAKLDPNFNFGS